MVHVEDSDVPNPGRASLVIELDGAVIVRGGDVALTRVDVEFVAHVEIHDELELAAAFLAVVKLLGEGGAEVFAS